MFPSSSLYRYPPLRLRRWLFVYFIHRAFATLQCVWATNPVNPPGKNTSGVNMKFWKRIILPGIVDSLPGGDDFSEKKKSPPREENPG